MAAKGARQNLNSGRRLTKGRNSSSRFDGSVGPSSSGSTCTCSRVTCKHTAQRMLRTAQASKQSVGCSGVAHLGSDEAQQQIEVVDAQGICDDVEAFQVEHTHCIDKHHPQQSQPSGLHVGCGLVKVVLELLLVGSKLPGACSTVIGVSKGETRAWRCTVLGVGVLECSRYLGSALPPALLGCSEYPFAEGYASIPRGYCPIQAAALHCQLAAAT